MELANRHLFLLLYQPLLPPLYMFLVLFAGKQPRKIQWCRQMVRTGPRRGTRTVWVESETVLCAATIADLLLLYRVRVRHSICQRGECRVECRTRTRTDMTRCRCDGGGGGDQDENMWWVVYVAKKRKSGVKRGAYKYIYIYIYIYTYIYTCTEYVRTYGLGRLTEMPCVYIAMMDWIEGSREKKKMAESSLQFSVSSQFSFYLQRGAVRVQRCRPAASRHLTTTSSFSSLCIEQVE